MRRHYTIRPAVLVLLGIVLLFGYWTTDRMDPALAGLGLNHGDCYQVLGSTYCGDSAKRFEQFKADYQTP